MRCIRSLREQRVRSTGNPKFQRTGLYPGLAKTNRSKVRREQIISSNHAPLSSLNPEFHDGSHALVNGSGRI